MAKDYSPAIADAIVDFFHKDDWNFKEIDENGVIRTGVTLKAKAKKADININVTNTGFAINSSLPFSADQDSMAATAEFIARANFGMMHGNFELDFRDGEIRYKTTLYCEELTPTFKQIHFLLYVNLTTLEKYANGLMKVVFGMATPKEAIDEIENS